MARSRPLRRLLLPLLLGLAAACGVGSSGDAPQGEVRVRLTGSAGGESGIDNAWITVRGVLFHRSATAEPEDGGWAGRRFADAETVTVNLAALADGALRTVLDAQPMEDGPWRQIRLLLEPVRAPGNVAPSAQAAGLLHNHQIDTAAGSFPLRVPDALRGIRIEGRFDVAEGRTLDLAIALDAGNDVVPVARGSAREYLLKPLPRVFDLASAGAVTGRVDADAASDNSAFLEILAEQPDAALGVRTVRRATTLAAGSSRFVLYPLAPGRYDVVVRGRNRRTVVVRNVDVLEGGTPGSGGADLGTITVPSGSEYRVDATASPSGAWVRFYQRLQDDPVPFEVRHRHLDPFTGRTHAPVTISSAHPRVGNYSTSGATISFSDASWLDNALSPLPGAARAVAESVVHGRSAERHISPALDNATLAFGALAPASPAEPGTAQGLISMSAPGMGLDNGILLAVRGGMVVDRLDVSGAMGDAGGAWLLPGLPGGQPFSPFARAVYGIDVIGWSDSALASGFRPGTAEPVVADLTRGSRTGVNVRMVPLR